MPSSAGARTLAFASAAGIAAASITAAWFAVGHLKTAEQQQVWVVHTRQGAGLAHFYEASCRRCARRWVAAATCRKTEQVDHLLDRLKPRMLIFDEFHNALRGRARDVDTVLAFPRRIGRQFDISPVLIGEVRIRLHLSDR